jgi:hypothetical protein
MKINKHLTSAILAVAALVLAGSARTQAQTIITNTFTFGFATGGASSTFNSTWIYWYNTPGGNLPVLCDPKTGTSTPVVGANTSANGSLEIISPFPTNSTTQNLFFGTFASNINNGYDFSIEANTAAYSNISFDILVGTNQALSGNGDFGSIGVGFISSGYGYEQSFGNVTIPASAATNWYHISVPIDQTQGWGDVPGIALDFASYSGYPEFPVTNWIANVAINGSTAPPPPPPTVNIQTPIVGLNLLDTSPSAADDRYHVATTNDTGYTFVGQPSVTYSWTIKTFPTQDPGYSYQAHFFMVNGRPGQYDQAADYNLADCIFVTVQSDGAGGGICSFRYKTNEAAANLMLFNTLSPTNPANSNGWPVMPVCTLNDTNKILGTWSLNFSGTTSVTITSPTGLMTNFTLDAASAALFADPMTLILGAQPNGTGNPGLQDVVYSSFSVSGNASPFTDNFLTDTSLNTNIWFNLANDPNGVVLVPQGSAYWLGWTLPAVGFSPNIATNLPAHSWQSLSSASLIKNGGTDQILIASNSLPSDGTKTGYFTVISNTFSQLLVLLPGQTFAPGAAPGYTGSPTPLSQGASPEDPYVQENVTVMAVDANFNPVGGITDTIALIIAAGSDNGAILPTAAPMVNGSVTFGAANPYVFADQGSWTVTAQDTTTVTIPNAASAAVTVGP